MAYYVVVLFKDNLYNMEVEFPGSITIGSGKKDDIKVPELDNSQITIKYNRKGQLAVSSKAPYSFSNSDCGVNRLIVIDNNNNLAIYVSDEINVIEQALKIPYQCVINVGRSDKNNIVIKSPFVSGSHFTIKSEAGVIHVEDNGSTNGLYLNGKRISKAKMRAGDVLSILNYNIRLGNSEFYFENLGGIIKVQGIEEEKALGGVAKHVESGEGTLRYRRSPRTQEQLPTEDIILASAPSAGSKFEKRRGMFGSLVGSGAMFAANMATGIASPALLAARAASLVSPITSIATQSGGEKSRKKKTEEYAQLRMEKYGQYIAEQKAKIESVAKVQRDIITRENPSADECITNLAELSRSLWERGLSDRDFLDVRIGMGYEDLCVKVKSRAESDFRMESDEVRELAEQIVEETRIVDNIPSRLSLRKYNTISVIGQRNKMINLVRNMIISITTAHCFEDVRIVGIFDEAERKIWESLKWLPHVWDENKQFRYLAFDQESAHQLCDSFNDVFKQRVQYADSSREVQIPTPYYIFVIGSRQYTEKEEIMNYLTSNNPGLGVTSLFLFDDLYSLPHSCQFIVDVDNGPCGYVRNEVNNKFFFTFDNPISMEKFDGYARQMSAIELEGFAVQADIPNGVSFLEGFGVEKVEQLNALSRWNASEPYKSLAAPIGIMAGEKTFSLDIHEKAHGPHGLVAGTTGSGKSETLQSWILSMCVCYHPHDVNFVIIDYKGGGMANLLIDLPHVVGKITNIGSNIQRSLISLQSEMKRRQRVFDQYDVNHIDKYQKKYREGKADEPMPHLIIVADEFAELKKEEPDFMKGLISASRIGRSLGVHLVLATQKPTGVVDDQIQSNSNFRLCLKVQDGNDSREMIKRPDAARITQAGRAYVRVGEDVVFALFQSYWSGASYSEDSSEEKEVGNLLRLVDYNGVRSKMVEDNKKRNKSDKDELTAVREYLNQVAEQNGIRKLDGPWLDDLPELLSVDELEVQGGYDGGNWTGELPWLKVPVGMYDEPVRQQQGVQYVDFSEEGHLGIYGAPSTGKTTLLKTLVWSIGKYYKPSDVGIYIIDCGGWSMNVFADMPHVGGIALDCEEEKIAKLTQILSFEISERKRKFLSYGVGSLNAYRQATNGEMPAIILAIDNIIPLFDMSQDLENLLIKIAQEGSAYGIYLVYTANNTTGVRYKVVQNIKGAVAFELTDKGDYPTIVGRLDGMSLSKVQGRCFFKGNPPIEFQSALPVPGETEVERAAYIKEKCAEMDRAWTGERPAPIPVMPTELSYDDMFKHYTDRAGIPLGISYDAIRPVVMDMSGKYILLVSGSMNTGKSALLTNIYKQINLRRPEDQYYIFDSAKGGMRACASSATCYASSSEQDKVCSMLAEIVDSLNIRKRAQNQARNEVGDDFSEKDFIADYNQICIFIDDLKDFVDEVDNDSKASMERICRLAEGLGVLVFVAGRVADIERYNEIESLTRAIVANQRAVAIGGNAAMHSYLTNELSYKEKDQPIGDGNGYVYIDGQCAKMKMPS